MVDRTLPDDLQRCIDFHGHLCPGLVTGYRAACVAKERLTAGASEDEELVAVVENDACGVDAVQVLLSCTFGKGNLIFHDYGKMVFTFHDRASGRSVRVALKASARAGEDMTREERIDALLTATPDRLFDIREADAALPPAEAVIRESVVCDRCDEPVMDARTRTVEDRTLCIPCSNVAEPN